jgi:hypothetical protein
MFSSIQLFAAVLALTAEAHTNPSHVCPRDTGARGVRVRLPPNFTNNIVDNSHYHPSKPWPAPPIGWYFKPWSMILASNAQYAAFRNVQYDPTAIDPSNPSGLVNDLFSFQFPGNDTVFTSYGIDTPHSFYPAVLYFEGTGIVAGATSEYSMLAWGCDSKGVPYYASYSSAVELTSTPAGIDLMSTCDGGPDDETVAALIEARSRGWSSAWRG